VQVTDWLRHAQRIDGATLAGFKGIVGRVLLGTVLIFEQDVSLEDAIDPTMLCDVISAAQCGDRVHG
jgi:hypothetical protein